jgi:oligopeptide/dipeptide ABC transporter ATP-binding protein
VADTLLDVRHLSTQFSTRGGVVRAVDDVSWDVKEGETVALVGESGCGKSVSALSIMRLVSQPAGRIVGGQILFRGRDLLTLSEEEMRHVRGREIAMIFQEPMTSLNPVLSIGRQLTEGLEIHLGKTPQQARVRAGELLAMVGIPDPERRLTQYPHQFSGGMRQRMMIAMALACEPSLILADEPTTALDVTIQAQILELMKDLSRRLGVAMLMITHNLGVVARYADRVNVMYAGRIIEQGTAREIYGNPRHPYSLGLLRSVPRLDEPRRSRLAPIDGQPPDLTRLPAGCAFVPRCAFRVDRCVTDRPDLRDVNVESAAPERAGVSPGARSSSAGVSPGARSSSAGVSPGARASDGATPHVSACWEAERVTREEAAR